VPVTIISHCRLADYSVAAKWLESTCLEVLKIMQVSDQHLSALIVEDAEMRAMNHQYRKINKTTNVLSFPFREGVDESLMELPFQELGDIVISIEKARQEAAELGTALEHRIAWLIVHGILHLLGYDHERSEQDAEQMFTLEHDILKRISTPRGQTMTKLAINVDHVATIRQARGITEPDPVTAAAICELAGASGIVVHLREDRRHIQDRDVLLLRQTVKTKLNLEMGANQEIIKFALDLVPDLITLVPEKRQELTTEGGLDVAGQKKKIAKVIEKMSKKSIPVSIFADPDPRQLAAAYDIGATFVELHTGRYCDVKTESEQLAEYNLLADAAAEAAALGLRVCAGHGLHYTNAAPIAALPEIEELSIGHSIIARAVFTGLDQAVREMLDIVQYA